MFLKNNNNKLAWLLPYGTKPLTHKQLETHGCVLSTVAANDLVLKHQAISIHSAD